MRGEGGGGTRFQVDVLVVGAGPAGAAAAREASRRGVRVLLVERRKEVGVPVRCGEFVPWAAAELVSGASEWVAQPVRRLVTHLPSGRTATTRAPGYVVHRDRLDRRLVREAVAAGALLWTGARLGSLLPRGGARIIRGDEEVEVRSAVLIGADGPRSLVARWLGNPPQPLAIAAQASVELERPAEAAEVFFGPAYPGGYGWLFPKGRRANVGAAIDPARACRGGQGPGRALHSALAGLLDALAGTGRIRRGPPLARTGGPVPIGGQRPRVQKGAVLLAGDAAGHAHPVTGAGIHPALVAGALAGRLAAQALRDGDAEVLHTYGKRCRELWGEAMDRAVRRRADREVGRPGGPAGDDAVRRGWVAFREYYRDGL